MNSPLSRFGILACALPCLLGGTAQANDYVEFAWNSGTLSNFLEEYADAGIGMPLMPPFAIRIQGNTGHTADVALDSRSLVTLTHGVLTLSGGGYSNRGDGLFVADRPNAGVVFITALGGLPEAPAFSNEGLFHVTGGSTLQINTVKVVNINGGVIQVDAGGSITSFNADIRNGSLFTGGGMAQIRGRMSGAIHSESSLSLGNGTTIADEAVVTGQWSWQYVSRLEGTLVNEGVVRGHPLHHARLGTLAAGGRFVNRGTVIGADLRLAGNDTDPSQITEFVNEGLVAVSSVETSGTAPARFVNKGRLQLSYNLTSDNLHFDNSGVIENVTADNLTFAGPSASRPDRSMIFRDGTEFTGGGRFTLTGRHEFHGKITAPNLSFAGTRFHGVDAALHGAMRWSAGGFSGTWTNLAALEFVGEGPGRYIDGVFGNLGTLGWRSELRLAEGSTLVNHGTMSSLTTFSRTVVSGTPGGAEELVTNFGRLLEEENGTAFYDLRFVNLGVIELRDGAELDVASAAFENLGTIMGNGRLRFGPDFVNEGIIAPGLSPGRLTVQGNFVNGADGVLELELASASLYDVLTITGTATLGGTLKITLLDGFLPGEGDVFRLLNYNRVEGAFAHIFIDGYEAEFDLGFGSRVLSLGIRSLAPSPVPLPPALPLLGAALAGLACSRRRRGAR